MDNKIYRIKKAKILALILQSLGSKVEFTEDDVIFRGSQLPHKKLKLEILEHKIELQEELSSDYRLMSISTKKYCVGTELKKLFYKYYPDLDCSTLQDTLDEYDARGCGWCEVNKTKVISAIQKFARKNEIESTYEQTRVFVKKAISNAKKTIIS